MSHRPQSQSTQLLGEGSQRVKARDARSLNIRSARSVADAIRSTLGPKGLDKMLVSSFGTVTITNDGVTILNQMDIKNPTASMVVEVAETQEDEVGDGTTTAVILTGELLKSAEELLEQEVHPTTIVRGYTMASEYARSEITDIARTINRDDDEMHRQIAKTSMTGKGAETNKEVLSGLIVDALRRVTAEGPSGEPVVDLDYIRIETQTGGTVDESRLLSGVVIDKDPVHDDMPSELDDATVLLLQEPIEVDEPDIGSKIGITDRSQYQQFITKEDEQLKQKVSRIVDSGANVVFCQKGIDDLAQYHLAKQGVIAARRVKKSDMEFMCEVLDTQIVSDLDAIAESDLGRGSVSRDSYDELFIVEGRGEHGVTILLRGATQHVVDEIERGVTDALDAVSQAIAEGRVLAGGGATEVELAARVREYADSVEGREQLAVRTFADALEFVPRIIADNAGIDSIDTLINLRFSHQKGESLAGLDCFSGEIVNTFDAGVVETVPAKAQAIASATEAANLVLRIDDIIAAGDLGGVMEDGTDLPDGEMG